MLIKLNKIIIEVPLPPPNKKNGLEATQSAMVSVKDKLPSPSVTSPSAVRICGRQRRSGSNQHS